MKKRLFLGAVGLFAVFSGLFIVSKLIPEKGVVAEDFKAASYEIEGRRIRMSDDSGVRYFGNEVRKDLNFDGFEDVIFLFTQDGGGSGNFYYAAAALGGEKGFLGTNAIFLGDRIAPQNTNIFNGIISVNYAVRGENEPMTAKPSFGVTKYLNLVDGHLSEIFLESGEELLSGRIIMGHENRSFVSCSGRYEYWIMGDSPAYKEMLSTYQDFVSGGKDPYAPMFAVFTGRIVSAPTDGFGADYKNAVSAREVVLLSESMNCE